MSLTAMIDMEAALARFGLKSFRPGQLDVISSIVAGHDCLCVMPTGGGKSLCYQLPALIRPGLTIVVSPLIALMKDQVDTLQRRGISATLINSTLTGSEQNERLQQVSEGRFSLVYVAPERLRNQRFLDSIRATPIQLLAIDEAHCISEWGHDFRPDYARIGRFRQWLGGIQTIALTATATPRVRIDIENILQLSNPKQFITGFARTNLHFATTTCHNDREKDKHIIDFLKTQPGTGIIYAATRKRCEELTETLGRELKMRVGAYHAGLDGQQRRFIQEQFMKGHLETIIATNAFGMGIDKANLRYVIHYNMPGSLEAYYQEAGRAGRDGMPSQCMLLYSGQDRYIQEFFIENSYPPPDCIRKIYEFLATLTDDPIELTHEQIRETLDLPISNECVGTALQILTRTGVLERLDAGGGLAMIRLSSDLPTLVDLLPRESKTRRKVLRVLEQAVGDRRHEAVYVHPRWLMQKTDLDRDALQRALRELSKLEAVDYVPPFRGRATHFRKRGVAFDDLSIDFETLDLRKKADYEKLDHVIAFAQGGRCRQLAILQYFGDPTATSCGICDRCLGRSGWFDLPRVADEPSIDRAIEKPEPTAKPVAKLEMHANVQQALIGVLKAVDRTHGRLGKRLIAQFLCGSEDAKVQRLRLQRLPEFGLLKQLSQAEAIQLMDALLVVALIEQQELNAHRPTVLLTASGKDVLHGKAKLPSSLPLKDKLVKKLQASSTTPPSSPSNEPQALAAVSPVKPQSRATIADAKPNEPQALAAVSPSKSQSRETRPTSIEEALEDWHWTWRLVSDGYKLHECSAIRRKAPDAIVRDVVVALRCGKELALEGWLDQKTWLTLRGLVRQMQSNDTEGLSMSSSSVSTAAVTLERLPSLMELAQTLHAGSKTSKRL